MKKKNKPKMKARDKQLTAVLKAMIVACRITSINMELKKIKNDKEAYKDLDARIKDIQRRYGFSRMLLVAPEALSRMSKLKYETVDFEGKKMRIKLYYQPLQDFVVKNLPSFLPHIASKVPPGPGSTQESDQKT